MIRWLIAGFLFFLIVLELVFFAPEQGDRELSRDWLVADKPVVKTDDGEEEEEVPPDQDIEQVISGSHLVESQGEKKLWELKADEARKQKGNDDWSLTSVIVKFFGENNVFYNAVGETGYVGENQKKLKISGDIEITSSNGYIMNTDEVYYKTDTKIIDGPKPMRLKGPKEKGDAGRLHMASDRFDADLTTNIINMRDNVRGRKKMSGGRKMNIASKKAIFSGASNYAVFKDDVVIDVDSMTITGARARFNYRDGELYSMFIDGGVKIKDIGKWGVAGEAEVFFKEDKYIFRGSPKVVQNDDQLVGEEIIMYDGGDRVQVRKAKTRYNTEGKQEVEI